MLSFIYINIVYLKNDFEHKFLNLLNIVSRKK